MQVPRQLFKQYLKFFRINKGWSENLFSINPSYSLSHLYERQILRSNKRISHGGGIDAEQGI